MREVRERQGKFEKWIQRKGRESEIKLRKKM